MYCFHSNGENINSVNYINNPYTDIKTCNELSPRWWWPSVCLICAIDLLWSEPTNSKFDRSQLVLWWYEALEGILLFNILKNDWSPFSFLVSTRILSHADAALLYMIMKILHVQLRPSSCSTYRTWQRDLKVISRVGTKPAVKKLLY